MNIQLNKRNLSNESDALVKYKSLKSKLIINFKSEICSRIETMKVLKEIKDNEYYKLDGYKNFEDFTKDYKLAKSQAYDYLKVAGAIEEGIIEESFLIENGFRQTLYVLRNSDSNTLNKSRVNPIKPLRFQLKSQESYDFYKKNAKFTSFLMDNLFENQKDLLEKLMKEFKSLKGDS
ncbi:Plasmid partition family protein (plasmid) [Borrelia nietonii YOR]|uniref:Plasmid partition family protein n=2 Tax=Borrelia TaxID=138 RepID=W5SC39_9SPIR|nr:chromosome replication/partitioning protein [Borrelia nietonii]AHH04502.1 Plasmid partition family protein [Borrelia nietonii YOR]UPA10152.1 chromosome replication/partitioning protein [Borrelia nietonii YOR]